ncbi:GNAT family N-acetyltransferase [Pelagovum pacificum]|uniref:GNAT family N-acetyltransferase n=2 Tax=Pelagovum pacificum TaxID=2588711 RepID=A0A5C5GHW3_9RHOB|nr:GNAT family N-acetyltransferase [Pelagovum pacificum]TNY34375.1 GNAT family N-acetyltransferase [Pelagovum pacificum]
MDGRIDPPSSMHRLTIETLTESAARTEIWVIGDPPVATMQLTPRKDVLYLGKIAVSPAMRGRGLARHLVSVARERAQALGLPALELQSRVELVENHATFRALGFIETGRTAHAGFDRPTSITFRSPA